MQVSVIGPISPAERRATTACAAQIRVVRMSSRIGLAQADWMSPALGAVVSVIAAFVGFDKGSFVLKGAWPKPARPLFGREPGGT